MKRNESRATTKTDSTYSEIQSWYILFAVTSGSKNANHYLKRPAHAPTHAKLIALRVRWLEAIVAIVERKLCITIASSRLIRSTESIPILTGTTFGLCTYKDRPAALSKWAIALSKGLSS